MCYGSEEFLDRKLSYDSVDSSVATLASQNQNVSALPTVLSRNPRYAEPVVARRSQATLADLRGNDAQIDDVLDFHDLSDDEKSGVAIVSSHISSILDQHMGFFARNIPSIKRFSPIQVKGFVLDALGVSLR